MIRGEPIRANVRTNATDAMPTIAVTNSIAPTGALTRVETSSPPPTASAAATAPSVKRDGYQAVGFDVLASYSFEVTDELLGPVTNDVAAVTAKTEALIPKPVKDLNQKRVELRGFMLPLKVEGGLVLEMLVMKDQSMCCFGAVPKINEWVSAKMNRGVKPIMDQPIRLAGTLHVGEMRENGYLVGIYRLDGERMSGPDEGSGRGE